VFDTDTNPFPQYLIDILDPTEREDEQTRNSRWARALTTALEQKADPEIIRKLVLWFVASYSDLVGNFVWIDILEGAGYNRETLHELLFARFEVEDPNFEQSTARRHDFLRYPPAWRLVNGGELVKFVMAEVKSNAETVLAMNSELVPHIGAAEAKRMAVLACRYVCRLTNPAAVKTVMRLEPAQRLRVAQLVAENSLRNDFCIRNLVELGFMVWAAMEVGDRPGPETIDIWLAIRSSITCMDKYGKPDKDRPLRVARWLYQLAREAPFTVEPWMHDRTTPDHVRQNRFDIFDRRLRQILADERINVPPEAAPPPTAEMREAVAANHNCLL